MVLIDNPYPNYPKSSENVQRLLGSADSNFDAKADKLAPRGQQQSKSGVQDFRILRFH